MANQRGVPLRRISEGAMVFAVNASSAGFVRWAVWTSADAVKTRRAPLEHGQEPSMHDAVAKALSVCPTAVRIASWWASPAGLAGRSSAEASGGELSLSADFAAAQRALTSAVEEIESTRHRCFRHTDAYAPAGRDDRCLGYAFAMSLRVQPATSATDVMQATIANRMLARSSVSRGQA